jgi:hypothetical protein
MKIIPTLGETNSSTFKEQNMETKHQAGGRLRTF